MKPHNLNKREIPYFLKTLIKDTDLDKPDMITFFSDRMASSGVNGTEMNLVGK